MSDDIAIADPDVGTEETRRVVDVLDSGQLADGPEVREFEASFADYCSADHAVATSNGTTALHTALEAVGVGPGDRVLTTPFSFIATANSIRFTGAEPTFADIDPETFTLDPDEVESALREGDVDAILAVHLYGLPAAMGRLSELADEYDVPLVEDAAQAHGAAFEGTPVGSLGDAAAFSFYPTKNMTTGEGGMVTTNDADVASGAARFVNHGRAEGGYEHVEVGHNFRMTSLAAAIGRAQLDRLPAFNEARRRNAVELDAELADTDLRTPVEPDGCRHVFHQYTVRCGNRDALRDQLSDHGIGSAVYYPICIHRQPAYAGVEADVPVAERVADEVLSLPVHPNVSSDDIAHIGDVVREEVTVDAV